MEEKLLKYPSSPFAVAWDTLLIGAEDVWGIIIVRRPEESPVSLGRRKNTVVRRKTDSSV